MLRVRPAVVVLSLVVMASSAWAEDARVAFLSKQLASTKDARVKAQTLLLLGQSKHPDAVPVVCGALSTPDRIVRAAAAQALSELPVSAARTCAVEALKNEADERIKAMLQRVVGEAVAASGAPLIYLSFDGPISKVDDLSEAALEMTNLIAREKLSALGASFAPAGETKAQAIKLLRTTKMKGYRLQMQVQPTSSGGLRIELMVLTYPENSLQGSWSVKASGPKYESLIKVMVPRVIDDAARELNWSK